MRWRAGRPQVRGEGRCEGKEGREGGVVLDKEEKKEANGGEMKLKDKEKEIRRWRKM